jgi:hypothetical protein
MVTTIATFRVPGRRKRVTLLRIVSYLLILLGLLFWFRSFDCDAGRKESPRRQWQECGAPEGGLFGADVSVKSTRRSRSDASGLTRGSGATWVAGHPAFSKDPHLFASVQINQTTRMVIVPS